MANRSGKPLAFKLHNKTTNLKAHARRSDLDRSIKKGGWDIVVLQEQSQKLSFDLRQQKIEIYPYAKLLINKIRQYNPRARIIFYMTMAHKNGDWLNRDLYTPSYTRMQKSINASYFAMAKYFQVEVAPVGKVWQRFRAQLPYENLYSSDKIPNAAGSYIAACVFHRTIFQEKCINTYHPSSLSSEKAEKIQKMIDQIFGYR